MVPSERSSRRSRRWATVPFSRNQQTYYTTARVDAVVTQKIRVFGSWLYQYQRETGVNLPHGDSTTGLLNLDSTNDPSAFPHSVGYTAPNQTLNFGADITLTPHLVSTTRFGYYFENYHDFGYPTSGTLDIWENDGTPVAMTRAPHLGNAGRQSPAGTMQQVAGHFNDPYSQFYTKQMRTEPSSLIRISRSSRAAGWEHTTLSSGISSTA